MIDVQQFWHHRMQHDPANRRLRGLFHAVNRREANAPVSVAGAQGSTLTQPADQVCGALSAAG